MWSWSSSVWQIVHRAVNTLTNVTKCESYSMYHSTVWNLICQNFISPVEYCDATSHLRNLDGVSWLGKCKVETAVHTAISAKRRADTLRKPLETVLILSVIRVPLRFGQILECVTATTWNLNQFSQKPFHITYVLAGHNTEPESIFLLL